jgi:RND superfamily putative drug exporter
MGRFLHRLGLFSFNNPWKIVSVWVLIVAVFGFMASQFMRPLSAEISIPGTQAQKAIDTASRLFPDGGKGTGRIVFEAHNGKRITDFTQDITALVDKVGKVEGVSQVASPFVDASFISDSGTIAYAQVQLKNAAGAVDPETLSKVKEAVQGARSDGLQIETGGDLVDKAPREILGAGEIGGVVLALVVLVVTLGSLIAAGMPLLTALVGIGTSMTVLFSMSQLFTINSTTPVLAVMLGLAVGIDYSLFIISKYRSYLLAGYERPDAVGRALGTAGNAVVFAALTVVIALAALSIVNIPFMTTMGLVGAGSIAVAALVAISLIPALLRFAGARVLGKKARAEAEEAQKLPTKKSIHESNHGTFWYRWGETVTSHPMPFLLIAVVVVVVIALPIKDMKLGLPSDQYAAAGSSERKAYDILTKGFGVGFNGPLTVVVEGLPKVSEADKEAIRKPALAEFEKQVAVATARQQVLFQQKAAQAVTPAQQMTMQQEVATMQVEGGKQKQEALAKIDKTVEQYAKFVQLKKVSDEIAKREDVAKTLPAAVVDDGTAGIIQVIPSSAPSDKKTTGLISELRDASVQKEVTKNDAVSLGVTGSTALQEDISAKLAAVLPQYLAIVVGLSLVLLVIAFRSIIVPIKATIGFLLSVLAMFGALVAVFQWGWFGFAAAPGPLVSFIPIIAIGILFGLAMDYEFFLVSGMHESYRATEDAHKAVVNGFGAGSKVVTAAGVIMISVFAGFVFNHDATIQAMGFGLAVGILVDAFIVRMTIVPAVMVLIDRTAWWLPEWLGKLLPHISIEGEDEKK